MEGKLLRVDLSSRRSSTEEIPSRTLKKYIGGRGLGAYLLSSLVGEKIDPLGAENQIIFPAGPAQGTNLFFSPKMVLATKSPLTNLYLYAVSSGKFGHTLRKAGFFALAIRGISSSPVYLSLKNDRVEIREAGKLWGMEPWAAQEGMRDDAGQPNGSALAIGPGGEKLIKYAAVMTGDRFYRAFARGGAGCVMGAKRLKGIIVSGDQQIWAAPPENFTALQRAIREKVKKNKAWADLRRRFGTGADIETLTDAFGLLPTRNWQQGTFEGAGKICTANVEKVWPRENVSCGPFCPAPCSHTIQLTNGPYQGAYCDGPEYETLYALGSNCGVDKFDAIAAAAQICDEAGIDTMTAGVCIGFAMECFERGLIGLKDTDGIELRFGNDRAMIALLRKIVNREGLGKLLAEGVRQASREIPGSAPFAMQAKGMELGGYECRGSNGQALQYAISNRGGCHHAYGLPARNEGPAGTGNQITGKGALVKNLAIARIICDSIAVCTFAQNIFDAQTCADTLSALFGESWSLKEMEEVGLRVMAQERWFNMREGISRKDDTLPERLLKEPKPDGPNRGSVVPLEALKDDYYEALGWDKETGNPGNDLLKDLEIQK